MVFQLPSALDFSKHFVGQSQADGSTWGTSTGAVPEAQNVAMLLAGLGLVGVAARRKQEQACLDEQRPRIARPFYWSPCANVRSPGAAAGGESGPGLA
ncbi:MAG: hypothetical protein ABIR54_20295 [Burkholderiaceae bacterium]